MLKDLVLGTLDRILPLLKDRKTRQAAREAASVIEMCAHRLRPEAGVAASDRTEALVVGILFRGVIDAALLVDLAENRLDWADRQTIEAVWCLIFDARDRLEYVRGGCNHGVIDFAFDYIEELENEYERRFGEGKYCSPEIVSDGLLCSLCGKDSRGCNHACGAIYDGVLCEFHPDPTSTIRAISIVSVPRDMRCRIWPWQITADIDGKHKIVNARVARAFRLDDFDLTKEPISLVVDMQSVQTLPAWSAELSDFR